MVKPEDAWNLQLGQEVCSNSEDGLNREWLVTNGIGGYAAGSLIGATTRSYHGLLVAALHPPVERFTLVAKIDEEVTLPGGQVLRLGANEYQDGTIDPQGFRYLEAVWLEESVPCFRYRLNESQILEKRIWMEYGQNTTYVQYTLHGVVEGEHEEAVQLALLPFCLSRDHHSSTRGADSWHFLLDCSAHHCAIRAEGGAPLYHLVAGPNSTFTVTGQWYWHIFHRHDHERGLLDQEDVYHPGTFHIPITPGTRVTLVLSAESTLASALGTAAHEEFVAEAWMRQQRRITQLLTIADHSTNQLVRRDAVCARLVVAADQFVVARPQPDEAVPAHYPTYLSPHAKTIIAGYPWFTDWGRDSMIALPGLLLATGRYSEARGLLKAYSTLIYQGLLPNRFPDGGEAPEYNTIDAMLWMFHALDAFLGVTGDWSLLKDLLPVLRESIQWYLKGTLFNIGIDARDGLVYGGTADVQLTWMDAKIDGWVVTPRHGKPVEVNALWYNALSLMESWAVHLSIDAVQYSELRMLVKSQFAQRFWYQDGGYLYDVIDVDGIDGQNDSALRPNQLLAASLGRDLLSDGQAAAIMERVTAHLLTPAGLRTLSPTSPDYHRHFNGSREARDSAYHQGTVWQWLIGPYIDTHLRLYHDRAALQELLRPLVQQLWNTCLGTMSEVAEPEPPFTPAGCFAQAWSVGELLRCWLLATEK